MAKKRSKSRRPTYIVTSILTGVQGMHSAPVLGVHTSLREAQAHYNNCVDFQKSRPNRKLYWMLVPKDLHSDIDEKRGHVELYKAYITGDDESRMTITLERWD